MARSPRPLRSAILNFVRVLRGVERDDLAAQAGVKESTVESYERGKREPDLPVLERLMSALGVSSATLEELLEVAERVLDGEDREVWVGPILVSGTRMRIIRESSDEMARMVRGGAGDLVMREWIQEAAEQDREIARQIGLRLRGRENLVAVVREDPECHLWSVAQWLCDESMKTAPRNASRAVELAEAALVVAEHAPGDERFKMRLEGYSWAHIGNGRRALGAPGALKMSDRAFALFDDLWVGGTGGDPYGLLDAGRVLGMKASLRRAQGRPTESLRLIRTAIPLAKREILPHLYINHAKVLEDLERYGEAIAALREATRWMSSQTPLHLVFIQQKNLLVCLCHLGSYEEAERLSPEVWELGRSLGSENELIRLGWLQGRIDTGRGRLDEAEERFQAAQQSFLRLGNTYDAALVSLDLASLYLEQAKTAKVRALVAEMAPVFIDQGVHHEAQKALGLFREAVEREAVSRELVGKIAKYLQRARRAPELRFDIDKKAGRGRRS